MGRVLGNETMKSLRLELSGSGGGSPQEGASHPYLGVSEGRAGWRATRQKSIE